MGLSVLTVFCALMLLSTIGIFSLPGQDAFADPVYTLSGEASCFALPLSGGTALWFESNSTCVIPVGTTLAWDDGTDLLIENGVELSVNGMLQGTIVNHGKLHVNGRLALGALVNEQDGLVINNSTDFELSWNSQFFNRGTFNNLGYVERWTGSIHNEQSGTVNNYNALTFDEGDSEPTNYGVFNNYGTVILTNDAQFFNQNTGVLNNIRYASFAVIIESELRNAGTINNQALALIQNNGSIILNTAAINNYGSIENYYYELFDYDARISNISPASINNYCGATVSGDFTLFGEPPIDLCAIGVIADATSQATGQSMYNGGRTFYGQEFGSGAAIVTSIVDCATVEMRKHGSPTGMAEIGFYDSNMNLAKLFGTIDVSTFTTGYKAYEFCLPSSDSGHLILENQILAVSFNAGDPINRIDVRRSNTGSGPDYDGLASYHVNYDGKWYVYNAEGNSRDLLFKLTNGLVSVNITPGATSKTDDAFSPNPVNIKVGDTVTWTNTDSPPHTVTSGTGPSDPNVGQEFNSSPDFSPLLLSQSQFSHTFTEAGEFPYFCQLHPNMVGTVSVESAQ